MSLQIVEFLTSAIQRIELGDNIIIHITPHQVHVIQRFNIICLYDIENLIKLKKMFY